MAWLEGWANRLRIDVLANSAAGSNYVLEIRLGESLNSTLFDVIAPNPAYFPSQKDESGDIRFALEDGTLCPFWVGHIIGSAPNRTAFLWVKVPTNLSESDAILYVYGNNPQASINACANPKTVFPVFDDFDGSELDTSVWAFVRNNAGTDFYQVTIESSEAHITVGSNTHACLYPIAYSKQFYLCFGGVIRISFLPDYAEAWTTNLQENPLDVDNFLRTGYTGDIFSYQKRTNGTITTYQSLSRSIPSVNTLYKTISIPTATYYYENGNQVNSVTTQDRYSSSAYLIPSVSAYNYGELYCDFLYARSIVFPEPYIIPQFYLESAGQPSTCENTLDRPLGVVTPVWDQMYCAPAKRGRGVIQGTVLVAGEPAHRRVVLFDRHTMRPLAMTWSDPTTGEYRFEGYDPRINYLVVCGDYTQTYNAAVADWVQAEVSE